MPQSSIHLQQFAHTHHCPTPLPYSIHQQFSPSVSVLITTKETGQMPSYRLHHTQHSFHMLLNIYWQYILPILCLPCFNFFLFFSTPLPYKIFPANMHMLSSYFTNNCLGNEISTYLIKFPWQYDFDALQITTLTPSTPFMTHKLATSFFSVSMTYLPAMTLVSTH